MRFVHTTGLSASRARFFGMFLRDSESRIREVNMQKTLSKNNELKEVASSWQHQK